MGGSGGGGRGLTGDELKKLTQAAREALKEGSQSVKKNVFISFAAEDEVEVNLLRGQAKKENTALEFNDWSVKEPFNSKNAEYIRRGIRERIRQSSVTICYLSNDTAKSKWVDWEIRESKKLGKEVIAMYKGSTHPSKLPPAIKEFGITLVPWDHKKIINALDKIT